MDDEWEQLKALMKSLDNEQEELQACENKLIAETDEKRAAIAKLQTTIAQAEKERASVQARIADVQRRKKAVIEPRKRALSPDEDNVASDANNERRASESCAPRSKKRATLPAPSMAKLRSTSYYYPSWDNWASRRACMTSPEWVVPKS